MLIGSVLPELNVLTHACTEAAVCVLANGKPVNLTAPLQIEIESNADISSQLGIEMDSKVMKLSRLRGLKNKPMVLFISYFHPRIGLTGSEDFTLNLYDIFLFLNRIAL